MLVRCSAGYRKYAPVLVFSEREKAESGDQGIRKKQPANWGLRAER